MRALIAIAIGLAALPTPLALLRVGRRWQLTRLTGTLLGVAIVACMLVLVWLSLVVSPLGWLGVAFGSIIAVAVLVSWAMPPRGSRVGDPLSATEVHKLLDVDVRTVGTMRAARPRRDNAARDMLPASALPALPPAADPLAPSRVVPLGPAPDMPPLPPAPPAQTPATASGAQMQPDMPLPPPVRPPAPVHDTSTHSPAPPRQASPAPAPPAASPSAPAPTGSHGDTAAPERYDDEAPPPSLALD